MLKLLVFKRCPSATHRIAICNDLNYTNLHNKSLTLAKLLYDSKKWASVAQLSGILRQPSHCHLKRVHLITQTRASGTSCTAMCTTCINLYHQCNCESPDICKFTVFCINLLLKLLLFFFAYPDVWGQMASQSGGAIKILDFPQSSLPAHL